MKAINAGGPEVSFGGDTFDADRFSFGGTPFSTQDNIGGTTEDALYQTERYGSFTYDVPVTNGTYTVELHFAELYQTSAGARSFNVTVEGDQVLSALDLFATAGHDGAYSYRVDNVSVSDESLTISLESLVNNGTMAGFAIYSADGGAFVEPPEPEPPVVTPGSNAKPRIINTTDMGADPDDQQSMVRQLVMANEYDIEGLITSTGCWRKSQSNTNYVSTILNAYAQAYPNLSKHADGFPTPEYLRSINVMGQRGYAMNDVGSGKDSPGSELIIRSVDKDDPRPVRVTSWGGCNTIAQALYKVRETRSQADLDKFISKMRVFDILGQGEAGNWIAQTFPNLLYIRARSVYGWQPAKGSAYIEEIQRHGPLGAAYPDTKFATEGDTPAFMHLAQPGLNDPDKIDQGGWGGRFSTTKSANIQGMSCMNSGAYNTHRMHGNVDGTGAITKWRTGYDNDFQARMDWAITSNYGEANHHPVVVVNGQAEEAVMYVNAQAGASLALSAQGTTDPDGDGLSYSWSYYDEPSSYNGSVSISNSSSSNATVQIPSGAGGRNIHVILTVRDNGSPSLHSYRRVVINVQ